MKVRSIIAAAAVLAMTACSSSSSAASAGADGIYNAGTYTGSADGKNGPVTVEVTVSDTAITEVKVTEHQETEGIADPAIADVPAAIVEKNSTDVDGSTGATITSDAIKAAVDAALESAKK